jgi:hypothetical protein
LMDRQVVAISGARQVAPSAIALQNATRSGNRPTATT